MKTILVPFSFTTEGRVGITNDPVVIVKQQIIDFFTTATHERHGVLRYGGNLQSFSFEILDPLVFADYKLDAISEANRHIKGGKIIDMQIYSQNNDAYGFDESTLVVDIKYSVSTYLISSVKLYVSDNLITEESNISYGN